MRFIDAADEARAAHRPRKPRNPRRQAFGSHRTLEEIHEEELEKLPDWAPEYLAAFDTFLRSGSFVDRIAMHAVFHRAHPETSRLGRPRAVDTERELCDDHQRDEHDQQPGLRLASR